LISDVAVLWKASLFRAGITESIMINRLASKKICRILQHQIGPNFLKRLSFTNATSWPSHQNGWLRKHGKSRLAVVLLGAAVGVASSIGIYLGQSSMKAEGAKKKKIVVLGSGWGAVNFLKHLKAGNFEVAVVSPSNYFLFTPFLPSVTVGTVEGRSTVEPIRKIVRKYHKDDADFFEAECTSVDISNKKVFCKDTSGVVGKLSDCILDYDVLVIAIGAETATYGTPGVQENAYFLKDIYDAKKIRANIMDHFETAAYPGQEDAEISRLLHFVVVGGGPTGVEFAAEMRDFVNSEIAKLYPKIKDRIKVTLIGGYRGVLSTYDQEIGHYVEDKFSNDKIDVLKGVRVKGIDENFIVLQEGKTKELCHLPYGMCVWAAGIAPRPLTKCLIQSIPGQRNRNSLLTNEFLQVKNAPGVFALGDCATVELKKLVHDVTELFEKADTSKDGSLSICEFQEIMEEAKRKYPQVTIYFNTDYNESLQRAFEKADKNKDERLSVEEFKEILGEIDRELKSLPATAQVATQQGKYLASLLSNLEKETDIEFSQDLGAQGAKPFKYRHLGSFAYVGDNRAVLELPIIGAFKGLAAMWLWRAAYTNECVGIRMKVLVVLDWLKSAIFGRDTSRI